MVLGNNGSPHRAVRVCKRCRQKRHDHVPRIGNSDRFHGKGSFCSTHRTTVIGRLYCNMSGKSRGKNVSPQLRKRRAALIKRKSRSRTRKGIKRK